jgi:predicted RNase H-like nuclease (RuvC/YqgF family)
MSKWGSSHFKNTDEKIELLEDKIYKLETENSLLHWAVEEDDATKNRLLDQLLISDEKIAQLSEENKALRDENKKGFALLESVVDNDEAGYRIFEKFHELKQNLK